MNAEFLAARRRKERKKGFYRRERKRTQRGAGKFNHGIPGIRGKRQKRAGEGESLKPSCRAVFKKT
jgi:hypothetical protein